MAKRAPAEPKKRPAKKREVHVHAVADGPSWVVYLLRCGDGSLYCGITNRLEKRLVAHQSGRGAAYTRSHGPVALVYSEAAADKGAALKREYAIKQLTRPQKLRLISSRPTEPPPPPMKTLVGKRPQKGAQEGACRRRRKR